MALLTTAFNGTSTGPRQQFSYFRAGHAVRIASDGGDFQFGTQSPTPPGWGTRSLLIQPNPVGDAHPKIYVAFSTPVQQVAAKSVIKPGGTEGQQKAVYRKADGTVIATEGPEAGGTLTFAVGPTHSGIASVEYIDCGGLDNLGFALKE